MSGGNHAPGIYKTPFSSRGFIAIKRLCILASKTSGLIISAICFAKILLLREFINTKNESAYYTHAHIHYLCHVASFNQWQCVRLPTKPTKQKQSAMPLVYFINKLVT